MSINFTYTFKVSDKDIQSYRLELDETTFVLKPSGHKTPWAQLEFNKCSHCPLKKETHPDCPIAVNIAHLVAEFKDHLSHTKCKVLVQAQERTYFKDTTVQIGLHSIFGVVMATSGCPHMNFLKPMARFHLPFASMEETLVRSVSTYLIRQYLKQKHGKAADFELKGLEAAYNQVKAVNQGILERMRAVKAQDAGKNAVVILDSFADILNSQIEQNLNLLEKLFPSEDKP